MDLRFSRAAILFLVAAPFIVPGISFAHDMQHYTPPQMFEEAVMPLPAQVAAVPSAITMQALLGTPYEAPLPTHRPNRFTVSPAYAKMLRDGKAPTQKREAYKYRTRKTPEAWMPAPITVQDVLRMLE